MSTENENVPVDPSQLPVEVPLNPPVQDAGLVAPPRLVRPGLLTGGRAG